MQQNRYNQDKGLYAIQANASQKVFGILKPSKLET